jgi:hypothetical protein
MKVYTGSAWVDAYVPGSTYLAKASNLSDVSNETAAMANLMGFTSTATAASTTTLTNTSSFYQLFTGTTTQTIVLPVTSTLQTGWTFHICNNSTGTLAINSSGGNSIYSSIPSGVTVMVTCIATGGTTAADWEAGLTDFSTFTGSGGVVLASGPTLSATTTIAGINNNSTTTNVLLGGSQTTGVVTIGNTVGTSILTVGQSTVSQTTNIQAGATASGSTKTMNIGTGGLTGSTTTMAIGSTFGTAVTANGSWTFPSTITGSISGNAGTATNGVVTTGSYADPAWITSLAGSKITGTLDGGSF